MTRRNRTWAAAVVIAFACTLAASAHADLPRRITARGGISYFILDSDFFGLDDGIGLEAALRYELWNDIYFENALGFFDSASDGADVTGFDYRLNLVAIFPVLIPYRPTARCGVGFISVNPVTVTPTDSFRPSQTTFYLSGGAGLTRSFGESFLVELDASFWITPYRYRVYEFDRQEVLVRQRRFTHVGIALSAAYTF